jgi:4-hydroxy-2-oxoheptanedioate aldolase
MNLTNQFKRKLAARVPQFGLWVGLGHAYSAEICAEAGFDWIVLDAEHAPNDVPSLLAQLQAVRASGVHAVLRPPVGHTHLIKQFLDIGAQTLLVPMVESAQQAQELVAAMRYPPQGVRGVASAIVRASRWNGVADYVHRANAQVCLLAQVETRRGLEQLDAILQVEGVDGVFIGPADLSAALGHLGEPGHPDVLRAIEDALTRIAASGKAAGILTTDDELARRYLDLGCTFIAVGSDVALLTGATRALAERFKPARAASASSAATPD